MADKETLRAYLRLTLADGVGAKFGSWSVSVHEYQCRYEVAGS